MITMITVAHLTHGAQKVATHSDGADWCYFAMLGAIDENLVTNYIKFLYANRIDLVGIIKTTTVWKFKRI